MTISQDDRFAFDVQGYLHLRGALEADEVTEYTRWIDEVTSTDPPTPQRRFPRWPETTVEPPPVAHVGRRPTLCPLS